MYSIYLSHGSERDDTITIYSFWRTLLLIWYCYSCARYCGILLPYRQVFDLYWYRWWWRDMVLLMKWPLRDCVLGECQRKKSPHSPAGIVLCYYDHCYVGIVAVMFFWYWYLRKPTIHCPLLMMMIPAYHCHFYIICYWYKEKGSEKKEAENYCVVALWWWYIVRILWGRPLLLFIIVQWVMAIGDTIVLITLLLLFWYSLYFTLCVLSDIIGRGRYYLRVVPATFWTIVHCWWSDIISLVVVFA